MQRIVASILLFSNLMQFAFAAALPSPQTPSRQNNTPQQTLNAAQGAPKSILPAFANGPYTPNNLPANLALTGEQFGLTGPVNLGVNYSDLTGTYLTAQYIKELFDNFAVGLIGEYGTGQYRLNGTLGFKLGSQSLFKLSLERFNQKLPFNFDSGKIHKKVDQDAIGARYQRVFDENKVIKALSIGGYHAKAHNINLAPIYYTSNGFNCLGMAPGLQCINERNIAGGISSGLDIGLTALMTSTTLVQGKLNYDSLRYNTIFTHHSTYDTQGLGGTVNVEQLLTSNLKLSGGAEVRKIYNSFDVALSWVSPLIAAAKTEISLIAQKVISHNQTPDNNIAGVRLTLLTDNTDYQSPGYKLNPTAALSDLKSFVRDPAVKMNQVLAIAEEIVRLVAPSIESVNPSSGILNGGNTIIIKGINFIPGLIVLIGGQPAAATVVSSTTLQVVVPTATQQIIDQVTSTGQPAKVDITIKNPDGQQSTVIGGYAYTNGQNGPPVVNSLTPTQGGVAGSTLVTISGSNLQNTLSVTFGGANATIVSNTSTQLIVATPAHVAGSVTVVVNTDHGAVSLPAAFTFGSGNVPVVSGVSPSVGSVNGGTVVTITGSNFTGTTSISFGNSTTTNFTINNDGSITVVVPPYNSGSLNVSVTVSNGTTNGTLLNGFTYQFGSPTISNIAPNSGPTAGGTTVTVIGTGFSPTTTVMIGNEIASNVTVIDSSTLTFQTPAYISGSLTKDVTVNNGEASVTLSGGFTYIASAPTLATIQPTSGSILGGTLITLTGTGFTPTTTITLDGTVTTDITFVSATTMTALTPAHAAGAVNVVVNNGVNSATLTNAFTYVASAPNLTTASPNIGPVTGGTNITLTGSNLTGITSVTVGGNAATNVTVVDDSTITATVPAYSTGPLTADITVSNGASNASLANAFNYQPLAPNLTSITPNSGSIAGGINVTLVGSGFIPGTTVSIGGIPATNITITNSTSMTVTIPAYVSGSLVKNVVVNNGVGSATLTGGFTYVANAPTLSGISPSQGTIAGGTLVTVTGSGFTPGTTLTIGGVAAANVVVTNSTTLTATTPAYVSGSLTVSVAVNNGVSNANLPNAFTYQATAPTLGAVSPSTGGTAGGTTITLSGTGFVPGSTVTIGGLPATNVTVVDATTITADTPAYAGGSLVKDVTISNGAGSATLAGGFTYTATAPTITTITPNSGSIAGGTAVTVSGTGFVPGTTLTVGGVAATNVVIVNTTTLTASTPAYVSGALAVDVIVDNGSGNATLTAGFTYTATAPTLGAVSPSTGSTTGGTTITLSGTGFVPGSMVTIGGVPATNVTVVNSTTITADTPAYTGGSLTQDVTINNGAGSATLTGGFTYTVASPSLVAVTPNSGSIAGGTLITLTGTNFVPGTTVTLDGVAATNITVVNPTTITALTPAHAVGAVDVVVNNGTGSATLPGGYSYILFSPTLSGISPNTGSIIGGTAVTLSGTNLTGITTVTVGGIAASSVVVLNDSTITAITPAYVSGSLAADVTVSDGVLNATLAGGFTYQAAAPTMTSISPNSSSINGGITATITGSGFIPGTTVNIGGVAATNVNVINSTSLTLTVPAYVSGALVKDVILNNGTGSATLVGGFTYTALAPTLGSISPTTGPLAGGTQITLTGSGFTPTTIVSVGGVPATNVVINNSTSLTALTPAYVSGSLVKNVVVTNEASNAVLNNAFTYQSTTPTLTAVSPNSGPMAGGTIVILSGTGFVPGTTVTVGGIATTSISIVDASTIQATVPAYVSGFLSKDIVVDNGSGAATLIGGFTYTANAPTLGSIIPNTGSLSGNTFVTLTGTGFVPGTTLTIGGVPAINITIVNSTTLTANTPAYASGPLVADVTINNGVSNATIAGGFTYQSVNPTLSAVNPGTGPISGGTIITLTGSGFVPGTTVAVGGIAATNVTIINATTLTATVPAYVDGSLAKEVSVNNGTGTATLIAGFIYTATTPTLASITPTSGSSSGGTSITLTGTNFVPGTIVSLDGVFATSVNVINSTTLTAITPAHAAGIVNVVVNNGAGSATLTAAFTYIAFSPNLTAVSPNTGSINGGTNITLTGSNLTGITSVTVGGNAATNVTVVDDSTITATVPPYITGPLLVDITASNSTSNASLPSSFTYQASAPTLIAISPNSSSTAGGITATLTGSGFISQNLVTIGGVQATNVTVISPTSMTVTIPAYVSGSLVKNVVVNNGVGSATLTGGFTYVANAPTLSGISPSQGTIAGGTLVTVTGSGFTPGTTLTIGGVAAANVVVTNSTTLTATTPAYVSGSLTVSVAVNNGVSNANLPNAFTYQATAPTLGAVSPSTGGTAGGTTITLSGTGFVPGSTVTIGGLPATNVTVVDATTITADTPAYAGGSLVKDVTISNGAGSATLAGGFTYTATAPTITTITPNSGSIAGGTAVTVSGTGFVPGTTLTVGGVAATNVVIVNTTTLTASTPAYVSGALAVDVIVDNGSGNATLTAGFTYTATAPTLGAVSPSTGSTTGGTTITLSGTGFVPGSMVTIGGVPATNVTVVNSTTITADTPAYTGGSLTQDVTINNGAGSATLTGGFTYTVASPSLVAVTPNSGSIAGGTLITLTGTNFVPGTTVTLDGVAATNITVVNPTTITALTPAHAVGAVDVVVNNGTGSATLPGGYSYILFSPTLSGISPNTGSIIGGTAVTLSGTNLTGITTVTVGGIAASSVVVLNDSTITAITPAYVSGSLAADVTVSDGVLNATLAGGFTYQAAAPTMTSISPNSSSINGGITATITGSGFIPGTTVNIGGVAATNVNVINSTSLTLTVPAYVSGALVKDVEVVNSIGNAVLTSSFTYLASAPTLTNISPNTGPTAGGTVVALTGTGFTPSTTVQFNGIVASGINVINANSLTAIVPAYISGSLMADVSVNNGVSNATLMGAFTYTPATPTIGSITPNSGPMAGGTFVTITGTNFTPTTTVNINSQSANNIQVINSTTLTLATPAYVSGPLMKDVTVNNGVGTVTLQEGFTYIASAPTLTAITPNQGSTSGGTVISLTGSGFTPTTTVTIGGQLATNVVVTNSTTLTAVTPAYINGPMLVDVIVNNSVSNAALTNAFTYITAVPTITAINPNTGPLNGGNTIVITGSNFTPGTTITIGNIPATNVNIVNSTTLSLTIPAYVSGSLVKDVVVNNSLATATLTNGYTYTEVTPTLASIAPTSGSTAGGTQIVITGSGFTPDMAVTIGGISVTGANLTIVNATTINATTPAHASGAVDVSVSNTAGTATLVNAFNYVIGAPTLTNISPNSGSVAGGTNITLTGTNLNDVTSITIGGNVATNLVVVNSTTLTATTPAYVSGNLVVDVTVSNPTANATLNGGFTYTAVVPTLTTVTPNTGTINGGTAITLTGSNFVPGTTVTVGGVAATNINVVNATTITAITPAYVSGSLIKDVIVTNSAGSVTLPNSFTYTPIAPTLVSVVPNTGPVAGGTTVTLSGTGFTPTTTVSVGGIAATSITVTNSTTLTAVTPAYVSGSLAADVVINNGISNSSLPAAFTYQPAAPTITTINPNSGPMSGGNTVTVNGTNFTPTTQLSIGGVNATTVNVINSTSLTAIVPAYVSGSLTKDVTITNEVSSANLVGGYTYLPIAPTITAINPATGPTAGNTAVTISGAGFTPATTVTIGGITATTVVIVNAMTITAATPAYQSGPLAADVVINNGLSSSTLVGGFVYQESLPTITNISPNSGTILGGTSIAITGTEFTPSTTVTIGGVAVANIQIINSTTMQIVTPAYVSGALVKDVVVTNSAGSATSTGGFTYTPIAPTLNSINPNIGSISGGTSISLTGSGFVPGTTLTVGGIAASNITVVDANHITAVTPAYVGGNLTVDVVVNNGVANATLTNGFTYQSVAPTITSITPNTDTVNGGTSVTVVGTGFVPNTVLTIGGVQALNINLVNSTTLTALVPAYQSGSLTKDVSINNGVSTATLTNGFTYTALSPTLTSVAPSSGTTLGGTTITLTGTHFVPGATVSVGGLAATNVTVVNATTLTANTPAYVSGSFIKDVVVTNSAGSATLTNSFTYLPVAPNLTSISPTSGTILGGTTVTFTGTNLNDVTSVTFGNVPATSVTVVNATTVTAVTPIYLGGSLVKDVTVSNGTANSTLNAAFTYTVLPPTLLTVSPNNGTVAGGNTITLIGTGFVPGSTVTVGGIAATNISVVNATTITATVPAYVSGSLVKDVTISNGSGSATLLAGYTYIPMAPSLSSITPNSGPTAGGTSVTITGTGFTPTTTVTIGGILASSISVANSTTLTAVTPAYLSGSLIVDVVVNNGVSNAVLSGGFTYQPSAPTITTVLPNTGPTTGGTLITITGSNFTPTTTLTIGGIAASNINVVNASTLIAQTPAYTGGTLIKDVVVNNGVSSITLTNGFTYIPVTPSLTSISPNTGPITGGTTVTLTGTGFVPGMVVTIGGIPALSINVTSTTTLTAVTPAYISGSLAADVTINNGAAGSTLTGGFTYQAVNPTLLTVLPNAGSISGGTLVTLTGTGFVPGTTVTIGGVAATNINVINTTTLTITTPAYVSGSLVKDVVVDNGAGTATIIGGFTYTIAAPTLTAVTPNTGSIVGGTTITLTGSGFVPGTTVTVGGIAATSITVVNATTITAVTPAYLSGSLLKDVSVSNGIATATLNGSFTYIAVAPTLSGIVPNTGTTAGGTTIVVTGTNFVPGTTVTLGGTAATGVVVLNSTTLTAVTPAHAAGLVNVVVNNGISTATLNDSFTYIAVAPTLLTVTPISGPIAGGTVITLTGTNLNDVTSVAVGSVAATNVNVVNNATVTATVPAYVSGSLIKDVTVSSSSANATLPAAFTYEGASPTISSLTPNTGTISGGTSVTVTGTNFVPGTTLTMGGIAATSVVVTNSTTMTIVTPAYVSGSLTKNVVINNGFGSTTLNNGFTYTSIAPTITSISPSTGSMAGGTSVTVSGTGFTPGTTLTIGGVAATSVTVVNATTLTAVTPAYVSGSLAADVVVNNGISNATLVGGFIYQAINPTITNISPNTGPMSGGTLITITGTNFTPSTTVTIGGIQALSFNFANSTSITVLTPTYVNGALAKNVVVSNSAGSATLTGGFTYIAPLPTLLSVSPNTGSASGGTSITLTGTGFTPDATVTIGGIAATSINQVNSTTITAITPAYASGSLIKDVVVNNGVGSATIVNGFTYLSVAPTLTGISPNTGPITGGTVVTLTGTGFVPGMVVTIGGIPALNVIITNTTTLTALTPVYVSGSLAADVTVNNGVSSSTLTGGFTYQAVSPTLLTVLPNTGSIAGGTSVTLTGTGFVPGTTVTIGGVAATNINVVNTTTLTLTTPAYVSGLLIKNVVVNNGAGTATIIGGFTYTVAAPTLTSVTPNTGSVAGNTTITLTGTGFVPGTTITVGGIAATNVSITSATTLTASTPAYVAGALLKDVSVNNGIASATLAGSFTYTASAPTLSGILPITGTTLGGTTITLTGTNFVPGSTVTVGGIAATGVVVINSTTLTAVAPAHAAGLVDVTINNGVNTATLNNSFTYIALAPTLSSLTPVSGSISGGTSITLTGTNLNDVTSVTVGGVVATNVTVINDTTVTATVPVYVSGSLVKDVTASSSSANATLTAAFTYTVTGINPTLTSISPNTGSISGGTVVTLTGTNFVPGTTVSIGGIVAASIVVNSATTITAVVPAYVSGDLVKNVVVNNGAGSATLTNGFTYIAIAPTIISILPNVGSMVGGTAVTVTGTGFTLGTTLTIGGVAATSVTVINATTLTAVTPGYVSGSLTADVVVNNGISNATLMGGFTYQAISPTITSISPNTGTMAGGTLVTISGTNFTPTTTVTIGGLALTSANVVNAGQITGLTPTYVSGSLTKSVIVNNGIATATLTNAYTYLAIAPTLTAVSPNSGPMAGGTTLTLTGTGFTPTTTVRVGGILATTVIVNSASSLTAITPAYVSGSLTKDVLVNNGNANATLANSFTYIAPAPTLVSITPNSGTTTGNTAVTVSGTGFIPSTTLTIGGMAATNINVVNSTTLTATTPAYASGSLIKTVQINNGVSTASLLNAYTYVANTPTIVSVNPNTGPSAGGTSVTITGTDFIPGTTVTVGGITASSITIDSATSITAVIPAYVSGSLIKDVVVTNTVGAATLTNGYTYTAVVPNVSSCGYTGGLLSSTWVCLGTNMNAFPDTYLSVQGGLLCTVGAVVTLIAPSSVTPTYIAGSTLLANLYSGCSIKFCNTSTCNALQSNIAVFP